MIIFVNYCEPIILILLYLQKQPFILIIINIYPQNGVIINCENFNTFIFSKIKKLYR